ncbi:MAG: hypothetical protein ABH824_07235 [Nanoarchaeota archaeon]|nr:hypothetical protein [Nanoarchaeota archaeon]MBU1632836.1 hypothetical protein [Nanoarchaeota archaeon]MBU1876011.1 hypothetical protein [Nanoarchaeota archaeon]
MELFIKDKKLNKTDKIQLFISYLLQLILILAIIFSLYRQNWLNVFTITGILFITLLPAIIRHSYKVHLPLELDLIVIIFVFASLFLGEVRGYYTRFWWWDVLLHTSSGILFGFAGFFLVYILNEEKKVHVNLKPFFVFLFSFAFANMIGVIWEIFEFSMDSFFAFNMQKSGLIDTMWDLIVNTLGSLVVATLGFFYMKKSGSFFERGVNKFVKRKKKS